MSPLCVELIKGAFTLAAAALGAWVALSLYFRQKEYELIKQRYLEGAVDVVAADFEAALGVLSHNWARCLHVVKLYRDEKEHLDLAELEKGFLDVDASSFSRVAHHRLGSLVGSQIIWQIFQLGVSFALNSNGVIKELLETIRLREKTAMLRAEREEIVDAMLKELEQIDQRSHKFAHLTRELYALGLMLEAERLSFKKLAGFSSRAEVHALVSRLQSDFEKELAPHGEAAI